SPPVPEAAAQMLRDEQDVQVFDASENDLAEISANVRISEDIIMRLDAIIASGDRTAIYPTLAARRSRIAAIEDDLITIRSQLAATRREIALGKDLSSIGDQQIVQARALRLQVRAAEDAEQRALSSHGHGSPALDRAARIALQLDAVDQQIDQSIARRLEEI